MRPVLSFVSPLAVAMLCTAAVRPAGAQHASARDRVRPVVQPAALTANASVRTLATYRFISPREVGIPALVTVADSAGTLVASFQLPGGRATRPMMVELLDADLVLQGDTPSGALTLRLYEQNDAQASKPVTGRWWLGEEQGALRGRFTR